MFIVYRIRCITNFNVYNKFDSFTYIELNELQN